MSIALVAHTGFISSSGNTNTSSGINNTGANFLVMHAGWYNGTTVNVSASDSLGNTWTAGTKHTSNIVSSQIFYAVNPSVGAAQTFTITGAGTFFGAEAASFSGVATASPFDVQNGAGSVIAGTSLQPGSITPNASNELLITGVVTESGSGAHSINSSFTVTDDSAYSGGVNEGVGMAYLIQGAAAAVNPTWSWSGSANPLVASIAAFKVAAGGGFTAVNRRTLGPRVGSRSFY